MKNLPGDEELENNEILQDEEIDADILDDTTLLDEDIEDADIDSELTEDIEKTPEKVSTGKAKLVGKHSLEYDKIFKGRKDDGPLEESYISDHKYSDNFDVDRSIAASGDSEDYQRLKRLKERVYEVITTRTEINIDANRRKPSRADFNKYFNLLCEELKADAFSKAEMFVELSYYFSDNLYNMFKLLDRQIGSTIINELKEKHDLSWLNEIDFL